MVFGVDLLHLLLAWLVAAIVLTVIVWRLTRSLSEWPRVLLRCLMLVAGFGFVGVGTDAAAIPVPLLLIPIRLPSEWPNVLTAFLVYWLLFVGVYFVIRTVRCRWRGQKKKAGEVEPE